MFSKENIQRVLSIAFGAVKGAGTWYVAFLFRAVGLGFGIVITAILLMTLGLMFNSRGLLSVGQGLYWFLPFVALEMLAPLVVLRALVWGELTEELRRIAKTMAAVALCAAFDIGFSYAVRLADYPGAFITLHLIMLVFFMSAIILQKEFVRTLATFAYGWSFRAAALVMVTMVLYPRFVPQQVRTTWGRKYDQWLHTKYNLAPKHIEYHSLEAYLALDKIDMPDGETTVPLLFYCELLDREGPARYPLADWKGVDRKNPTCKYEPVDETAHRKIETHLKEWESQKAAREKEIREQQQKNALEVARQNRLEAERVAKEKLEQERLAKIEWERTHPPAPPPTVAVYTPEPVERIPTPQSWIVHKDRPPVRIEQPSEASSEADQQPQVRRTYMIQAGTPFPVRINEMLSSKTHKSGDSFSGTLIEDVARGSRIGIIPQGTPVRGRIVTIDKQRIILSLTEVQRDDAFVPLATNAIQWPEVQAPAQEVPDAPRTQRSREDLEQYCYREQRKRESARQWELDVPPPSPECVPRDVVGEALTAGAGKLAKKLFGKHLEVPPNTTFVFTLSQGIQMAAQAR